MPFRLGESVLLLQRLRRQILLFELGDALGATLVKGIGIQPGDALVVVLDSLVTVALALWQFNVKVAGDESRAFSELHEPQPDRIRTVLNP